MGEGGGREGKWGREGDGRVSGEGKWGRVGDGRVSGGGREREGKWGTGG